MDLPGRGRTWVWDSGPPANDPGAPTVLLLHGWTTTAALNWCRCFRPLARSYRVIALDHRGHGRGIRSLRPFTLEDCADDAAALLRVLRCGPAVTVGYSMGGPVAQLLWRRHPEVVTGLVLCATAARFGDSPLPARATQTIGFGLSVAFAAVPPVLREQGRRCLGLALAAAARTGAPTATGTGTGTGAAPAVGAPSDGLAPWAAAETNSGDPVALVQAGAALASYDALPWLGEVDAPTVVVVTTADRLVAPARQAELARAVPDAEVMEVEADHRGCVESAAIFVPALIDAVGRVSRATGPRD